MMMKVYVKFKTYGKVAAIDIQVQCLLILVFKTIEGENKSKIKISQKRQSNYIVQFLQRILSNKAIEDWEKKEHGNIDQQTIMYRYKVSVVKVVDGDTVDVDIDLGFGCLKKQRVRMLGIDTPESRTRDLVEKKLVKHQRNILKIF